MLAVTAVAALIPLQNVSADSVGDNKVVRDGDGDIVTLKRDGSCVRTTKEKGFDTCAKKKTILSKAEKNVFFEFDKAELTEHAKIQLTQTAQKLKNADDIKKAVIIGYADRFGPNDYNKKLSEERAHSVKEFLAEQGYLNTEVAIVEGKGEDYPITNCEKTMPFSKEVDCLQPDRRVELDVRYIKTQYSTLSE